MTVSWPLTAQACVETLATRKLPYTLPSFSGGRDEPTTPSWSAPHPGTPGAATGGIGPEPIADPPEPPGPAVVPVPDGPAV